MRENRGVEKMLNVVGFKPRQAFSEMTVFVEMRKGDDMRIKEDAGGEGVTSGDVRAP